MRKNQPSTWFTSSDRVKRRTTTSDGISVYVDHDGNRFPSVPSVTSRIKFHDDEERLIEAATLENYGRVTKRIDQTQEIDSGHLFWFARQVGRLAHYRIASDIRDIGTYEKTMTERELIELNEQEVRDASLRDVVYSIAAERKWVNGKNDPSFEILFSESALLHQAREDVRKIYRNWELVRDELGINHESVQAVEWMSVYPIPNEGEAWSAGFGGQIDLIYKQNGRQYTAELKTSDWLYPEYIMQAVAYKRLCPLDAETQIIRLGRDQGDYAVFSSTDENWPDSQQIWQRFKAEALTVCDVLRKGK
ncbi:hypothetical protein ACLI4Q_10900 [Natrialbaceae archaeon A-CW1-1]